MLAIAPARAGGETVDWIEGTVPDLPIDARFEAAVMTGHVLQVFQIFLSDAETQETLRALQARLARGGQRCSKPAIRSIASGRAGQRRRPRTRYPHQASAPYAYIITG